MAQLLNTIGGGYHTPATYQVCPDAWVACGLTSEIPQLGTFHAYLVA